MHFFQQALDLLPPNAVGDLARTHEALGTVYFEAADIDRAFQHFREAIRYCELQGDLYATARTRRNVAKALVRVLRLADAREYLLAALRDFETFGDRAAQEIEVTKEMIAGIEKRMKGG
jgi:tetratricopeptide (TPR) repeat protein